MLLTDGGKADSGQVLWLIRYGGGDIDQIVASASAGCRLAITGNFSGTANFGGSLQDGGSQDAFVAVYDTSAAGIVHRASTREGGPGAEVGTAVTLGFDGGLYVVGTYVTDFSVGGTSLPGRDDAGPDDGGTDDGGPNSSFLIRYDNQLKPLYVRSTRADGGSVTTNAVVEVGGELAQAGTFDGTVIFGGAGANASWPASFVVWNGFADAGLGVASARTVSCESPEGISGRDLAAGANGGLYLSATLRGANCIFGTGTESGGSSNRPVVIRYASTKVEDWHVMLNGSTLGSGPLNSEYLAIASDPSGNSVWIAGEAVDLLSMSSEAWVAQFDSNGALGPTITSAAAGFQSATDVAVDAEGNAVVVGNFGASFSFGGGQLNHDGGTGLDFFVAKFTSDGGLLWSRAYGGRSDEQAVSVTVHPWGIVVAASCSGTLRLDGIESPPFGLTDVCLIGIQP